MEGGVDGSGGLTVNLSLDLVRVEANRANKLIGALLGEGEGTVAGDLEGTASREVVKLGNVEGSLDGGTRRNALEGALLEVLSGDHEPDTVKGNTLLCHILSAKLGWLHWWTLLTTRENLNLLDRSRVEEGTGLHDLEVILAIVGNGGLDLRVADELELDIERSRGTLLGGSSGGHGGHHESGEELHGEGCYQELT